jgi:hypothetical protein
VMNNEKRPCRHWTKSRHLVQLGAISTSTDSRFYVHVNRICKHYAFRGVIQGETVTSVSGSAQVLAEGDRRSLGTGAETRE